MLQAVIVITAIGYFLFVGSHHSKLLTLMSGGIHATGPIRKELEFEKQSEKTKNKIFYRLIISHLKAVFSIISGFYLNYGFTKLFTKNINYMFVV